MTDYMQRVVSAMVMASIFVFSYFCCSPSVLSFLLAAILCYILVVEWPRLFPRSPAAALMCAPLYPIVPFTMIIMMNENFFYHRLVLYLFVMTASFDGGCYLIGSWIGKHLIAPSISPRKNWEGFVGGYLFSLLSFFLITFVYAVRPVGFFAILFTFLLSSVALLGDLFESWLKRRAGLKDSGNLLPGHGGFLDRFDSIVAAGVLIYFLRNLLIRFL